MSDIQLYNGNCLEVIDTLIQQRIELDEKYFEIAKEKNDNIHL